MASISISLELLAFALLALPDMSQMRDSYVERFTVVFFLRGTPN
jgi:hypothetical protein